MVSDSGMLMSISNHDTQVVTPKSEQPIPAKQVASPELTPSGATLDAQSSVSKGNVEQISAVTASGDQQSIDSSALNNNQSPRQIDPFSTAGTILNSRG